MLPVIDVTRSPLVVIRFPTMVGRSEIDQHFDEVDAVALGVEGGRLALVVDLRETNLLAVELREHLAARMRAGYPDVTGRIVGVAHVVGSPLTLAAMRTLWWLAPPPFATFVTRSLDDAIAWGEQRLERSTAPNGVRPRL